MTQETIHRAPTAGERRTSRACDRSRAGSRAAPGPVRAAFRVLERAAPSLGARWAEHLWFALPRRQTLRDYPSNGRDFAVTVAGGRVRGTEWGTGPTVYLMHGWAGHRGHLAPFVAPLVQRGHRVVAFDAPSHGASEPGRHGPRSSSLPEFADALAAVVADRGPAHAIVAHSMGAAAAAVAVADGTPAGRIAMLAPMASPRAYGLQFGAALGFGARTYERLMIRIERRVGTPLHRFDVPALGQAGPMPPTLIIHDREDGLMPPTHGTAIASAWPGSRLRLTAGLGHRRLLRDPDVVTEVVSFVCAA